MRDVEMVETGQVSRSDLAEMEQYLGPSVLAKLQSMDDDEDFEVYEELEEELVAEIEEELIEELEAELVDELVEEIGEVSDDEDSK